MTTYLEFEKPIAELESKISELRHLPNSGDVDIAEEVMRLQARVDKQIRATYAKLTSWQRVQVARHAERPHAQRYIDRLITDYTPLAGDRAFAEDAAIVGGLYVALGPTVGAVITILLAEILRVGLGTKAVGWDNLIYGLLLVLFIIFLPKGVLGSAIARFKAKR